MGIERVAPAPWFKGGHLLAPSGTMSLPNGYLGRWCCACGAILKRTPSSSEAFEEHLADLRESDTLVPDGAQVGVET